MFGDLWEMSVIGGEKMLGSVYDSSAEHFVASFGKDKIKKNPNFKK